MPILCVLSSSATEAHRKACSTAEKQPSALYVISSCAVVFCWKHNPELHIGGPFAARSALQRQLQGICMLTDRGECMRVSLVSECHPVISASMMLLLALADLQPEAALHRRPLIGPFYYSAQSQHRRKLDFLTLEIFSEGVEALTPLLKCTSLLTASCSSLHPPRSLLNFTLARSHFSSEYRRVQFTTMADTPALEHTLEEAQYYIFV